MKALILNSGMGTRMGVMTSEQPKCMTEISPRETILSRQLRLLEEAGIRDVIITTGYYDKVLVEYCENLDFSLSIKFVKNPLYSETNYIYSIYCAREYLHDSVVLMHGDLVFEPIVLDQVIEYAQSCMKISSTLPLPKKDFKAVVVNGKIEKVGIEFFENAYEAQALYKLNKSDWEIWLNEIISFCESGNRKCYAEAAFNAVSKKCNIFPLDVNDRLCSEIDTPEDYIIVKDKLKEVENRIVYMCFSADMLHTGHFSLIRKARKYGKVIIGVLTDDVVSSYKNSPVLPQEERKNMFENIKGVYKVVYQKTLSYADNIREYRPNFVIHGDDWQEGIQKEIREEVIRELEIYGGRLIEYPYTVGEKYARIEKLQRLDV